MNEPTPRQVLYAWVATGFLLVVLVFVMGAAIVGLVPIWWTVTMVATVGILGIWSALNWLKTGPLLVTSIGLFVVWTVGTLLVA